MTRRIAAAWLAMVLGAGTASAESFAERLRARMKPKPQAQCQAKVDRMLRRGELGRSTAQEEVDSWDWDYAFPRESTKARKGNVVDCDGAAKVDELLERKERGEDFGGDEPPYLELSGPDLVPYAKVKLFHRRNYLDFGARVAGQAGTLGSARIGFFAVLGGTSFWGPSGLFGVIDGTKVSKNRQLPEMHEAVSVKKPSSWVKVNPIRTDAPWVKTRLDSGELYFGQFFDGRPHGYGYVFAEGMHAGRMGFFRKGKPHDFQVEWRSRFVQAVPEGGGEAVPACTDYVRRVDYEDGKEVQSWWIRQGAIPGYELEGIPTSRGDHSPDDRKRMAAAEQAKVLVANFRKLQKHDLIKLGDEFFVTSTGFAEEDAKRQKLPPWWAFTHRIMAIGRYTVKTLTEGDHIEIMDRNTSYKVPGYGTVGSTQEDREALRTEWWSRKEKPAPQVPASSKSYSSSQSYSSPSVSSSASSYSGGSSSSSSSYGPLVGSSAWHEHRALISHPVTYYQNKY